MMHMWKKLLACLLAFAVILPLPGASAEEALAAYGVCTGDQINVRKQIGGAIWFKVDEGHVAQILGTKTDKNGDLWYKIESPHPEPNGRTYTGYIMGDYFRPMTDEEIRDYLGDGVAPLAEASTGLRPSTDDSLQSGSSAEAASVSVRDMNVTGAKGEVTADNVRVYAQPSKNAAALAELNEGAMVEVLTIPDQISVNDWYRVRYASLEGYIQANFIRVTDRGDSGDSEAVALGVTVNTEGVNFRIGPGTHYSSMGKLPSGVQLEILSIPDKVDENHWYYVRYNGKSGYIQAPYIQVLGQPAPDAPDAGEGTPASEVSTGVTTSTSGVKLRNGPGLSYSYYGTLPEGTVVELLSIPQVIDEAHWYKVRYNSRTGYIQAPFIRVLNVTEDLLPEVSKYGYARLIKDSKVNLRDEPGGDTITQWSGKGSMLRITGEAQQSGLYTWYPVYHVGRATILYVREDMIQVVIPQDGSLVPLPSDAPSKYGYVITTSADVNLRIKPAEDYIAKVPRNTILACVGPAEQKEMDGVSYTWYKVKYNGMTGYLRGDCVMVCDENGNALGTDEPTTPPVTNPDPVGVSGRVLQNAHLRKGTSTDSEIITVMPANAIVAVLRIPEDTANGWYKVSYNGTEGYVHASLLEVISGSNPGQFSLGYVMVTGSRVAVRRTPAGIELTRVDTGTVWPIIGNSAVVDGVTWFNVRAGGYQGYVHGDYAFKLSPEQEESYLAGNGVPGVKPTPKPEEIYGNYLMTVNTKGLNIRESASQDSTSYGLVPSGVVMPYFGIQNVGTVTWYCVLYDHQERWVHGDYVDPMTQAEYAAWAANHPNQTPNKNDHLGYVKTNQSNVYVRNAANGSTRVTLITNKGTVMRYYAERIYAGGSEWYRVLTPKNGYCYVRADLVEKCDENGGDLPIPMPGIGDLSSAPQSQQETSYSTLRLGDGGTDTKASKVLNLVKELINQGYYKGKATDVYTSDVKAAVEAFQAVKGLYVDGIAGSATQHALFGTVPVGAGNTNNLEFTLYPAEKIDWFTGGIQDMIPRGSNFKVYDVKTGIVWWAHRWAGVSHADIETLTAADSKRLCEIYGVSNLQQIVDKNLYQRRPCLVTIGTRTFACSLDGMQHNPAGDTIPNNGMNGQICLHFTNSKGHASGAVSDSHAKAIEYAYENCPTGQK